MRMTVLTVNRLYGLSVKVHCGANDTNENNSSARFIYNNIILNMYVRLICANRLNRSHTHYQYLGIGVPTCMRTLHHTYKYYIYIVQ